MPQGFALVSKIERFKRDGTPEKSSDRWSIEPPPAPFSLRSYLDNLSTAQSGYYRVIVLVVTDALLETDAEALVSGSEAEQWWKGGNFYLPPAYLLSDFTDDFTCTALIYVFKRESKDGETVLLAKSEIQGRVHLEQSNLIYTLAESRER